MEITLNTNLLNSKGLSADEYVYLYFLYKQIEFPLNNTSVIPHLLATKGLVRLINDQWTITSEALELFEQAQNTENNFIENYRNLFPKGVKSGNGTSIRGDRIGVTKKMQWFLKTYPEFSKQLIIEATQNYINTMRQKAYKYMMQADYFIQKDGMSKLAAECESFNEKYGNIDVGEKRL